MKLYIVRHGETDNNRNGIIQGIIDTPLNSTGINQAKELKEKLKDVKFDLVISSPLQRAKVTAEIINDNKAKIICDNKIIERSTGDFEGQKNDRYDHREVWNYRLNTDLGARVEKVQDLFKRANEFLNDIKNKYPDKTLLIVSHSGFIRALHFTIVGFKEDEDLRAFTIDNCALLEYNI